MAIHQMSLYPTSFRRLKSRRKEIELRLYDEKRRQINIGDEILFANTESGEELKARVVGLLRYKTFDELIHDLGPRPFGTRSIDKLRREIRQVYSADDEAQHTVLGLRLDVI